MVKMYALMFYAYLWINCVATESKLHFQVRSFLCAPFLFGVIIMNNKKHYTLCLIMTSIGLWIGALGAVLFVCALRNGIEKIISEKSFYNISILFYTFGDLVGVIMLVLGIKLLIKGIKK